MTIAAVLQQSTIDKTETEILLAHTVDRDRSFIRAFPEFKLHKNQYSKYSKYEKRRYNGEPIAYILGWRDFFGLRFKVDKRVLVPRPETENLVDKVIEYATANSRKYDNLTIVDVGTGSANIAISLAKHLPDAKIYTVEVDNKAFILAKENIKTHKLSTKVKLLRGDLLEPVNEKIDIIVANLPYIPTSRLRTLQPEVSIWEPKVSLDGGKNGMSVYKKLFEQAENVLKSGGVIFYEVDGKILTKK